MVKAWTNLIVRSTDSTVAGSSADVGSSSNTTFGMLFVRQKAEKNNASKVSRQFTIVETSTTSKRAYLWTKRERNRQHDALVFSS